MGREVPEPDRGGQEVVGAGQGLPVARQHQRMLGTGGVEVRSEEEVGNKPRMKQPRLEGFH